MQSSQHGLGEWAGTIPATYMYLLYILPYRTAGNIGEEQILANVFQTVKIKTCQIKIGCDNIQYSTLKIITETEIAKDDF